MAKRSRNMQIISVQKSNVGRDYERKMKTKKDREEGDEDESPLDAIARKWNMRMVYHMVQPPSPTVRG
eukprot:scaffold529_cov58-Cyclotella_meneghiniana.AAC.2